ncbi:MAG: helix-hairpin-helix domain-containing protein [Caldicoprobacterales bacterium]|nr:hypothetical protein [Clostridiales bacterium]
MVEIQSKHIKLIAAIGVVIIGILTSVIFKDTILQRNNPEGVVIVPQGNSKVPESQNGDNSVQQEEQGDLGTSDTVKIYITGQVRYPGVIEVPAESRLIEAVEKAGGFLDEADLLKVNLALRVQDEGMYIIPKIGEECPVVNSPGTQMNEEKAKVNINTADQGQLETLPRIGPVIAGNIINYREQNGAFRSEEDLMNVPGIGQKTFDGLKDLITVK